ncbi:MAG TPA: glycosyltransferase [Candidatus Thermoplasmatota archaeon]|nr:glycosyltransferase [Candidatus Thermoplasmatota archaeon]
MSYFPDKGLTAAIRVVARQVNSVILYDNGSSGASLEVLEQASAVPGISMIRGLSNEGVARALNEGLARLRTTGHEWALLLDQDTLIDPQFVSRLLAGHQSVPSSSRVGAVVPWFGGLPRAKESPEFVLTAITSGTLLRVDAFDVAGRFRNDFFIDYVDHEYCLRLAKCGFRVLCVPTVKMTHRLGKTTRHQMVLSFHATHHSALRRYYMTRNRLVTYRLYWSTYPAWVLNDSWQALKELAKILFVEAEKRAKLRAIFLGVRDACKGRMGICGDPVLTQAA